MRWTLRVITLFLGLVYLFMPAVACGPPTDSGQGSGSNAGSSDATQSPDSSPDSGGATQQGMISGVVTYRQGIRLPDAQIFAYGVSSAGQAVNYNATTDSNGSYSIQVADGNYEVAGVYRPPYQGDTWELPLDPVDDSENPVRVTRGTTVTKDFQWLLEGPKPSAQTQPYNPFAYYGAYIQVEASNGIVFDWSPDAHVDFTLEPTGPLMDDSIGRTLTYRRTVEQLNSDNGALDETKYLHDIPIGPYQLTAVLTMPDGTTRYQLYLFTGSVKVGSDSFQQSVDVQFQPSNDPIPSADGPEPLIVQIYEE